MEATGGKIQGGNHRKTLSAAADRQQEMLGGSWNGQGNVISEACKRRVSALTGPLRTVRHSTRPLPETDVRHLTFLLVFQG